MLYHNSMAMKTFLKFNHFVKQYILNNTDKILQYK